MLRRVLTLIIMTAGLALVPVGSAAFADGPYSNNPSSYCSDGTTPPGGYEASTPGPYGSTVGIQFGQDQNRPQQLFFHDSCVVVAGPSACLPWLGCVGGKVIGEYDSTRFYGPGFDCYYQVVHHSDHDAMYRTSYYYIC